MKILKYLLFIFTIKSLQTVVCNNYSVNKTNNVATEEKDESSKILSRRKRFLIFPDGSSFQLVFCVQTAALIPIGDIFLYSSTAALAWNLPTDPMFLYMFKGQLKDAQRRGDVQHHIYYVDDESRVIAKVPYKRKPIVNPAFAKRSVDDKKKIKQKLKLKIDRMKMHEKQLNRDYLKREHMDANAIEFHRSSRVGLFEKLETLFTTLVIIVLYACFYVFFIKLGQDGRQCVLYKLCEAAQVSTQQGTFFKELLTVVFTLPKGAEFENEEHKKYDMAHTLSESCAKRYPGCEDFSAPL